MPAGSRPPPSGNSKWRKRSGGNSDPRFSPNLCTRNPPGSTEITGQGRTGTDPAKREHYGAPKVTETDYLGRTQRRRPKGHEAHNSAVSESLRRDSRSTRDSNEPPAF